jgi:hypothetical protein
VAVRGHYRCAVRDEAFRFMRDSFYVTVGFGVLAVQKLQVRRRELERSIDQHLSGPREQFGRVLGHSTAGTNGAQPDAPA